MFYDYYYEKDSVIKKFSFGWYRGKLVTAQPDFDPWLHLWSLRNNKNDSWAEQNLSK